MKDGKFDKFYFLNNFIIFNNKLGIIGSFWLE